MLIISSDKGNIKKVVIKEKSMRRRVVKSLCKSLAKIKVDVKTKRVKIEFIIVIRT